MAKKFGKFGKNLYKNQKTEFDREGTGEYQINYALANNAQIGELVFKVNEVANEVYNILPEIAICKPDVRRRKFQLINQSYPQMRLYYLELIHLTQGVLRNSDRISKKQIYTPVIEQGLLFSRKRMDQVNIRDYCENIFEYIMKLQQANIFGITASIKKTSGETDLFTQ